MSRALVSGPDNLATFRQSKLESAAFILDEISADTGKTMLTDDERQFIQDKIEALCSGVEQ